MGILDAPPIKSLAAGSLAAWGHSYLQLCTGTPTTTLSAAITAGDDVINVASTTLLKPGATYQIRDATASLREEFTVPRNADITSTAVQLGAPLAHAHNSGTTVVDQTQICGQRLQRMLGNPVVYRNYGVSGASMCIGGDPNTQAGFSAVFQLAALPTNIQAAHTEPVAGVNLCVYGLNDVGDVRLTAAGSTAVLAAYRHAMRSVLARFNLGLYYDATTAFPATAINTTFAGSGAWSTVTDAAGNYKTNTSSVATITHALPSNWGGPTGTGGQQRFVDVCLVGNYVGGSIAASIPTFTVDGVTVYPTGSNAAGAYSGSNQFTTIAQNPATFGTALPCVARIPITPTGGAQTLTITSGTGGISCYWIGYEADYCMPTIWTNVCCTPDTTTQQRTAIPLLNAVGTAIIAEFGSSLIAQADIYSVLSPGGVPDTQYWTTSIDGTHPNTWGNAAMAKEQFLSFQRLPLTILERANL